jgi:hypothetical protein
MFASIGGLNVTVYGGTDILEFVNIVMREYWIIILMLQNRSSPTALT